MMSLLIAYLEGASHLPSNVDDVLDGVVPAVIAGLPPVRFELNCNVDGGFWPPRVQA